MANEQQKQPAQQAQETKTVKVKVTGPGAIMYGQTQLAIVGQEAILTPDEYESVKHLVQKL